MTRFKKMMLKELKRRNYSESTTRAYLTTLTDFARYFNTPPDQLGREQIRQYLAHLFRDRKLADNTDDQRWRRTAILLYQDAQVVLEYLCGP